MNDKELMQKTYAAPLHEQLASVPENARLVIDDPDGMGTRFIPVGRLCHEAAAALRERLAQPERQWQGLTSTELREVYIAVNGKEWCLGGISDADSFCKAVEAKLKEKNQ